MQVSHRLGLPQCLRNSFLALLALHLSSVHAWSLTLSAAPRRVFLHVGNGTQASNNGQINLVQVSVAAAALGNAVTQTMTTNSTQSNSLYDGYQTCPTPLTQIMVGASYQRSNSADGPASATLRVSTPTALLNAAGDTLAFGQISWTVSAPGSPQPNVIPAGTFNGGPMTLATIAANTYIENCHSFSYANSAVVPAGTYDGRATYTLSSP